MYEDSPDGWFRFCLADWYRGEVQEIEAHSWYSLGRIGVGPRTMAILELVGEERELLRANEVQALSLDRKGGRWPAQTRQRAAVASLI